VASTFRWYYSIARTTQPIVFKIEIRLTSLMHPFGNFREEHASKGGGDSRVTRHKHWFIYAGVSSLSDKPGSDFPRAVPAPIYSRMLAALVAALL